MCPRASTAIVQPKYEVPGLSPDQEPEESRVER